MPRRRAGRASRRRMCRGSFSRRRASSPLALPWLKPPLRRIQPGGLPTSTRRRRATAPCVTNSSASRTQVSPNDGSVFSAPTLIPIRCLIFRKRGLRSERNGPSTLTFIPRQSAQHRQAPMRASGRRSLRTWKCGVGSRATWANGGSRSILPTFPSRCWRATGPFIRPAWSSANRTRRRQSSPT